MTAAALTQDRFLGGRLHIWQPRHGYRAGIDPVLLAAAVPARAGQSILELGCGVGVASLCLGARVPDLSLSGVELQPDYADLARRNAVENDIGLMVVTADFTRLPTVLKAQSFDHVIANPPYFQRARGTGAQDAGRETALGEETPLRDWIETATRRLVPGGWLTMIQRAERLPDMVGALTDRLGSGEVLPLSPRQDRAAKLVILRARKGGRGAFRLHAPLVLHGGTHHTRDCDSYTPQITAILRQGAAVKWPA